MLALLLLALASPEVVQTENDKQLTAVKGLSVTIPSEIGSAIKPYIDCLVNADNESIGEGIKADGDVMRSISAKSRETCLPVRTTAAANAAELLERYPRRTAEERDAMIQSALASAESLSEGIAAMMDQHKAIEAKTD